ncbi:MAG: hypothetical protein SFZ03_05035 [Candidatus Melainabacteria bacterium]|nr:hypothetical protein [Candidatus Melainabacteria bacterium]
MSGFQVSGGTSFDPAAAFLLGNTLGGPAQTGGLDPNLFRLLQTGNSPGANASLNSALSLGALNSGVLNSNTPSNLLFGSTSNGGRGLFTENSSRTNMANSTALGLPPEVLDSVVRNALEARGIAPATVANPTTTEATGRPTANPEPPDNEPPPPAEETEEQDKNPIQRLIGRLSNRNDDNPEAGRSLRGDVSITGTGETVTVEDIDGNNTIELAGQNNNVTFRGDEDENTIRVRGSGNTITVEEVGDDEVIDLEGSAQEWTIDEDDGNSDDEVITLTNQRTGNTVVLKTDQDNSDEFLREKVSFSGGGNANPVATGNPSALLKPESPEAMALTGGGLSPTGLAPGISGNSTLSPSDRLFQQILGGVASPAENTPNPLLRSAGVPDTGIVGGLDTTTGTNTNGLGLSSPESQQVQDHLALINLATARIGGLQFDRGLQQGLASLEQPGGPLSGIIGNLSMLQSMGFNSFDSITGPLLAANQLGQSSVSGVNGLTGSLSSRLPVSSGSFLDELANRNVIGIQNQQALSQAEDDDDDDDD